MKNKNLKFRRGFGLLEVVIGVSILLVFVLGFVSASQSSLRASDQMLKEKKASFLAEEKAEMLLAFSEERFSELADLTKDENHYLQLDQGQFFLQELQDEDIDIYNRSFRLFDVYRDNNTDQIAETGYLDEESLEAQISVVWGQEDQPEQLNYTVYLFDDVQEE